MAKTAWGKAFSRKFKELQSSWKRTGRVNGRAAATWKTAFKLIGAEARAYAEKFGPSPLGKKGKRKGAKRRSKKRAGKKRKSRKARKTRKARPKMAFAARKVSRPAAPRKPSRPKKSRKAARPAKVRRPRRNTSRRSRRRGSAGENLGYLRSVETAFGSLIVKKGGRLVKVGSQLQVVNASATAPRALIKRGRVAIKSISVKVGGKLFVKDLKGRSLDIRRPEVLIIS